MLVGGGFGEKTHAQSLSPKSLIPESSSALQLALSSSGPLPPSGVRLGGACGCMGTGTMIMD